MFSAFKNVLAPNLVLTKTEVVKHTCTDTQPKPLTCWPGLQSCRISDPDRERVQESKLRAMGGWNAVFTPVLSFLINLLDFKSGVTCVALSPPLEFI